MEPARSDSDGPDAAELMEAYGFALDPWQRSVLDCWLGKSPSGAYSATTCGLAVPRQNGKTALLLARELFGLLVNGEKILHTAHQVRTSKDAFHQLEQLFENDAFPELGAMVTRIRRTNGEEEIELANGGRIRYSARTRGAARGFGGISLVVFDEAQELTDEQLNAIMAVLAASSTGERQLVYTGTPPYPSCPGTVFARIRDGLDNATPSTAWHEWSVEGSAIEEIDVADRDLWYATNPALGIRLDEEFTAEECRTMSPDGFARERLGWWSVLGAAAPAIPTDSWAECKGGRPRRGRASFGVRFSPDGSAVALAGAMRPEKGPVHVELVDYRPQGRASVAWVADFLAKRKDTACMVAIDGLSGASELAARLHDAGFPDRRVRQMRVSQAIEANSRFLDAVLNRTVTHPGTGALDESARGATRRAIGNNGAWGFQSNLDADATPVEAAALAYWAAMTAKHDPSRKARVG